LYNHSFQQISVALVV